MCRLVVLLCDLSKYVIHMFQGRSAGVVHGIPVYPQKIRQNTPKYPKFIQMYPKLIEALYTVYLKLVVSG